MSQRKLEYSGGNPWDSDFGQIVAGTEQYVLFRPICFNEDGTWKPEVIDAMRSIIETYLEDQRLQADRDWEENRKVAARAWSQTAKEYDPLG